MHANPGDWLVVDGTHLHEPHRHGLILEVHHADGSPPTWCAGATPRPRRSSSPARTLVSSPMRTSGHSLRPTDDAMVVTPVSGCVTMTAG